LPTGLNRNVDQRLFGEASERFMERQPDCYRYSRFCELYRGWASRILVTMRQTHAGGDKLFVDYAGDAVPVILDRLVHNARRIDLAGDSLRRTRPRPAAKD
jgi:transposase